METGPFSGPSALLGPENGIICFEFLQLCCRPRKGRFFNGNGPFLAHLPFGGPKMVKFASNFCYCAVDQDQWKRARFWPICPFGARNGQICFEFLLLRCKPRKGVFKTETVRFLAHLALSRARNGWFLGPCAGYPQPERCPRCQVAFRLPASIRKLTPVGFRAPAGYPEPGRTPEIGHEGW